MCSVKKRANHRISVWVIVFALLFGLGSSCLLLDAHAATWMDDVGNDARHAADQVGDAARDAGDATGRAVEDMMDMNTSEGRVRDGDGKIGNEENELTVFSSAVGRTTEDAPGAETFNNYDLNQALGTYSHAEGSATTASGDCTHAEGIETRAGSKGYYISYIFYNTLYN